MVLLEARPTGRWSCQCRGGVPAAVVAEGWWGGRAAAMGQRRHHHHEIPGETGFAQGQMCCCQVNVCAIMPERSSQAFPGATFRVAALLASTRGGAGAATRARGRWVRGRALSFHCRDSSAHGVAPSAFVRSRNQRPHPQLFRVSLAAASRKQRPSRRLASPTFNGSFVHRLSNLPNPMCGLWCTPAHICGLCGQGGPTRRAPQMRTCLMLVLFKDFYLPAELLISGEVSSLLCHRVQIAPASTPAVKRDSRLFVFDFK